MSIFTKLFNFSGDPIKTYSAELATINSFSAEVEKLTQEQIQAEIKAFQDELKAITDQDKVFRKLEQIRPRVFALTREASKRALGQFHYDVQVIGGIILSEGKIAEMRTGEGKTLTATLPLVLYAIAGRGAHLVTVNDYLSRWHASIMGPLYHYLGLSVASIQHEQSFLYDPNYQPEAEEVAAIEAETQGLVLDVKHMRPVKRRDAYNADITYGTNNEYGFDYLRDNMVQSREQLVQRDLFFVIVDEVDSILIDEARTPLIISQADTDPTDKYVQFAKMVHSLDSTTDFTVDEKHKSASLTDAGISKIEKMLNVDNIYDTSKGMTTLHHIEQALRAETLYHNDRDYVVRDGEVIIVDEFTGRLMFGRRYSEGLHQAIEAKEGVKIQQESRTLATITFQNLFRLYGRLAGMTGTGKTEDEEFFKIYKLHVVTVPTHKPNIRQDLSDIIYKTEDAKFAAIAAEIKARYQKGQPVLVGTVSIAKNELLAEHLKKTGVPFEILNAKNHEREASIIAQAGRHKAVTVATNIAGRGVDILLGGNPVDPEDAEKVRAAGGLHVIGTERHESRRIDNQLRGRAGRQGDPGSSQFFISMEDDLMRLFGGERMKNLMTTLRIPDNEPIEARLVSRSIEQAQKKIEGLNFDTRKHVLEFDDVLNHQRTTIYRRRRQYLLGADGINSDEMKTEAVSLLKDAIDDIVTAQFNGVVNEAEAIEQVMTEVETVLPLSAEAKTRVKEALQNAASRQFALVDLLTQEAELALSAKAAEFEGENYWHIVRYILLSTIDALWMEHLDTMDHLRDSVRLRGYGQRDPLVEYRKEGHQLFTRLQVEINRQVASTLLKVTPQVAEAAPAPQPVAIVTNQSDAPQVSSTLVGESGDNSIGRNDPCPCGSGKKYKKCGLLNTPEHQKLMAGK